MSGTAAGITRPMKGVHAPGHLFRPLVSEVILVALGLILFNIAGPIGRVLLAACLCFALGLQNGSLDKLGSVSIHSTYITGISTSLVTAAFRGDDIKRSVLLKVIACFVVGAFAGALLAVRFGEPGFSLVILPLATALCLSAWDQYRMRRKLL